MTSSPTDIEHAKHIKRTVYRKEEIENTFLSVDDIFFVPENQNTKKVKYAQLSSNADAETENFMKIDSTYIEETNNIEKKLINWILSITENELASFLRIIPKGNNDLLFTPWQRLFIYFICYRPISSTVSLNVPDSVLENIQSSSRKRKLNLCSQSSTVKGYTLNVNIITLATGCGKSSTLLAISNTLLTNKFEDLKNEYINRKYGTIFKGPSTILIARLAIVCSSGGVHSHWVNEFSRLKEEFESLNPGVKYIVWNGQGNNKSVKDAYEMENTIVFWFLQLSKLNEELSKHPDYTVSVCITDEMTIDSSREKYKKMKSDTICKLLPQATPHMLVSASSGMTNWLKEEFDGEIIAPNRLSRILERNDFKSVQLGMNQYCKLSQYMPTLFIKQTRIDLQAIIPVGIDIILVKSKRGTLSSYLLNTNDDIVPASFNNVLISKLSFFELSESQEFRKIVSILSSNNTIDISNLIEKIKSIKMNNGTLVTTDYGIQRMIERMEEFTEECPICCNTEKSVKMMTCCSYCVCETCHSKSDKCAFCRKPISDYVGIPSPIEDENGPFYFDELSKTIYENTKTTNLQMKNLKIVLKSLKLHKYKRTLLIVDFHTLTKERVSEFIKNINDNMDITVYDTEGSTNGKGSKFLTIKHKFDDEKIENHIVLLCSNSIYTKVLIGVDFKNADSVVSVGKLNKHVATQILGRINRPNSSRDNTKYVPFVNIYS